MTDVTHIATDGGWLYLAAIHAQLDRLIAANDTRVNFREKLEELIAAYNAGSTAIEQLFQELVTLSRSLDEEKTRQTREQLTEEELVVFDILTRPGPDLTTEERDEVLPRAYSPEVFKEKAGGVFDHVYRRYGQAA